MSLALGSLGFFDTLFPVTIYGSTRTTENTCARTVYLGRKLLNEWPIYVWIEKYHKKYMNGQNLNTLA